MAEEQETRLKASALLAAVRDDIGSNNKATGSQSCSIGTGVKVLMVDHQDSFVHNLASYFRRCGVDLITLRPEMARDYLQRQQVDLLVLSPGPATPAQFDMSRTIELALQRDLSIFGVCLGLQGIVEYFGGELVEFRLSHAWQAVQNPPSAQRHVCRHRL